MQTEPRFSDTRTGQAINGFQVMRLACLRAREQGMDEAEVHGILRRCADEEDAREMMLDLFDIEVFMP